MDKGPFGLLTWAAVSAALAACSVGGVPPDASVEQGGNAGYVVVALARTGAIEFDLTAELRAVGKTFPKDIVVDSDAVRSDFGKVVIPEALNAPQSKWGYVPSDSPLGRVVVAALPAGDYEIATVLGKSPRFKSSHAPTFDIGSDAIDLRFTVRPGQITYLGSVVFGFPDWLSYSRADGPLRVALVDTHDRDAKVVTERYPALGRLPERDTAGAGPAIRERKYYLHLFGEGGTPKD